MKSRLICSILLASFLVISCVGPVQAQELPPLPSICTIQPVLDTSVYPPKLVSLYLICKPDEPVWNHQLVVFAHGYVPSIPGYIDEPYLPLDQLFLVTPSLPEIVTSMGYAFAMPSYPVNGLATLPGVQDVLNLVQAFRGQYPATSNVFLVGASEGGLVTTLAMERNPLVFKGGLAACGPIGNFQYQVNHFGDFRVLFDYYFPGILPVGVLPVDPSNPTGPTDVYSAINVPPYVMALWDSTYKVAITSAVQNAMLYDPLRVKNLFATAKTPADPSGADKTAVELLWYNAFATMDARVKLSLNPLADLKNPYDNLIPYRWYSGSNQDALLNAAVPRFQRSVLDLVMNQYQTNGRLRSPLVTMHNTGDPIVPYAHESMYTAKTLQAGTFWKRINIPITSYGHCNFTAKQLTFGFALMILRSTGSLPTALIAALGDGGSPILTESEFRQMEKDLGPKEIYIPIVH